MLTMTRANPVVENYGWQDASETNAHEYIKPVLVQILRRLGPKKVLDLGCGNGALTHVLRGEGYHVVGCDADGDGIQHAQEGRRQL
jgi:2-polyprenyl-6-hydroxyphenyl methylase/3-demethylubiquinone-9 3-methyltransferase